MKKKVPLFILLALAVGVGVPLTRMAFFSPRERETVFYGNVEDRQLDVAFLISERIAEIFPEEGSFVEKGALIGRLETVRIEKEVAAERAEVRIRRAAANAAASAFAKAKNGSRAEDVAAARGELEAIRAEIVSAEKTHVRYDALAKSGAVSADMRDSAEARFLSLKAQADSAENRLAKLIAGEREEDVSAAAAELEQAEAALEKAQAELAVGEQRLRDAELFSPCAGIVRKRLLEPGEMGGPQNPALSLAVISPKWIRIYLPETLLPRMKLGAAARVAADGAEHAFAGTVGYISPTAEFTPKNIETPELRASLLYECRVYVNDPENALKLGAPASVFFSEENLLREKRRES